MDLKARERTWLQQLDLVFKDDTTMGDLITRGKVSETQNSLKLLMHKRIKIWWNKAFLEKYLQRSLIPRGLRIQVFPSFPIDDENFTTKWEEACTCGSFKFMELLIGHNKKSLEALDVEIEVLQKSLNETSTEEEKSKFNIMIEKAFITWEKEVQEGKTKKFSRDLNDLQQKRVYKWKQRRHYGRPYRSSSVSSMSSQGEANTSHSQPMVTRYNHKKRKDEQKKEEQQKIGNDKRKLPQQSNPSDTNLKVINLSSHVFSDVDLSLLQKGLSFSPSDHFDNFSAVKDLHIFARSLIFKRWFHKQEDDGIFDTEWERDAVKALEELAAESEPTLPPPGAPNTGTIPGCVKKKSRKFPPLTVCPTVDLFMRMVSKDFNKISMSITDDNLSSA